MEDLKLIIDSFAVEDNKMFFTFACMNDIFQADIESQGCKHIGECPDLSILNCLKTLIKVSDYLYIVPGTAKSIWKFKINDKSFKEILIRDDKDPVQCGRNVVHINEKIIIISRNQKCIVEINTNDDSVASWDIKEKPVGIPIIIDNNRLAYSAENGDIIIFNTESKVFTSLKPQQTIKDSILIGYDKENELFISTYGKNGICLFNQKTVKKIGLNGLMGNYMPRHYNISICSDGKKYIWMAVPNNPKGVLCIEKSNENVLEMKIETDEIYISDAKKVLMKYRILFNDNNDNLYIYSPKSKKIYMIDKSAITVRDIKLQISEKVLDKLLKNRLSQGIVNEGSEQWRLESFLELI